MKANAIFLVLLVGFAGCMPDKKERANVLLKDSEMADEIFNAIINDSSSLESFMVKLHATRNKPGFRMHQRIMSKMCQSSLMDADSMMMRDPAYQGRIMRHMLRKCDRDSLFCLQMSDSVMRHDRLRKTLKQKMGSGKQRGAN